MADTAGPAAGGRPDRGRAVRMALAFAGCLVALAWLWAARAGVPSDGTVVSLEGRSWSADWVEVGVAVGPGNPLRAGDRVLAIDGCPLTDRTCDPAPRIGDIVSYEVLRDGSRLELPVPLVERPFWELVAHHALTLPYVALLILIGCLAVAHRPRDPAAVAIYGVTVLHVVGLAADWYGTQVIDLATGRLWPTAVAQVANCLVWACMLHFAMSFPQPWPVLSRKPRLVLLAYALPFAAYGVWLFLYLPDAQGLLATLYLLAVPGLSALIFPVLIVAAAVTGYVLARDPIARRSMRLVGYTIGLLAANYLLLGRLPEVFLRRPLIDWQLLTLLNTPAQLLFGAAVLRYRLWDVQIVLRRWLIYGVVTVTLLGIYLAAAVGLAALAGTSLGVVPVVLVVVAALSFAPARQAVRRVVSRLLYGEREDPDELLRQLGRRLESASSAEAALNQVVSTLERSLRLKHAAIEVPGLDLASSSHGSPGATATVIDLIHDGERIGRLVLDPGADREPFGASDRKLLEGLARQVSASAHTLLLAARLQRSLGSTVTVLEEERRRLRREIHDGLGPTLASASLRLDICRSLVRTDPAAAELLLVELAEVNRSVVRDIRELVDGLRPTILDHHGLEGALRELVARLGGPVRTSLDCAIEGERLPAAVEVAVYRIVSEALTNVVRHAGASTCEIRVWRDDAVHVVVTDDGSGLRQDYPAGMGLASIRERCAELGGAARIEPNDPNGTVVRCRLPVTAGRVAELAAAGGRLSRSRRAAAPAQSADPVRVPAS